MLRRAARLSIVALVLGAVTTVATAWVFAKWVPGRMESTSNEGLTTPKLPGWYLYLMEEPGYAFVAGYPVHDLDFHGALGNRGEGRLPLPRAFPAWKDGPAASSFAERPGPEVVDVVRYYDVRGWPRPALARRFDVDFSEEVARRMERPGPGGVWGAVSLAVCGDWGNTQLADAPLPMRPLIGPFVYDTVALGIGWFAILTLLLVGARWSWRRRVTMLIVALLLAPLTTIGTAWACAWWADARGDHSWDTHWTLRHDDAGRNLWLMNERTARYAMLGIGDRDLDFAWHRIGGNRSLARGPRPSVPAAVVGFVEETPPASRLRAPGPSRVAVGYGWPVASMWTAYENEGDARRDADASVVVRGLEVGDAYGTGRLLAHPLPRLPRALPVTPIAAGFAVDSLLAVVAWSGVFLLMSVPGALRRQLWAFRGRCHDCGYDVRVVNDGRCPECGWMDPGLSSTPA